MRAPGLPPDVQRFLAQHIDSVEQLEVLLLLLRTSPRRWSSADLAAELRVSGASVDARLAHLEAHGFAVREEAGHYHPAGAASGELLRQVADAYRERRVAVIACIFSKPAVK